MRHSWVLGQMTFFSILILGSIPCPQLSFPVPDRLTFCLTHKTRSHTLESMHSSDERTKARSFRALALFCDRKSRTHKYIGMNNLETASSWVFRRVRYDLLSLGPQKKPGIPVPRPPSFATLAAKALCNRFEPDSASPPPSIRSSLFWRPFLTQKVRGSVDMKAEVQVFRLYRINGIQELRPPYKSIYQMRRSSKGFLNPPSDIA